MWTLHMLIVAPAQLMTDFRDGYFNQALAEARAVADQVGLSSLA